MIPLKLPAAALFVALVLQSLGCSDAINVRPSPSAEPAPCDATAAAISGISIAPFDFYGAPPYALGYPPYSIDSCALAYVAGPDVGADAGALFLRDLVTGADSMVALASEEPRRPTLSRDVLAWEATIKGRPSVRVWTPSSTVTVEGPFDHAGEPRAVELGVALTGWLTSDSLGDTDIFLYSTETGVIEPIAPGPGQQRFSDISTTYIAFTDFNEDPDGRFDQDGEDLSDVVLYDRATGGISTRASAGKQAFPMLGADGRVGYLGWGPSHPEPKFSEYDLRVGELAKGTDGDVTLSHIVTNAPYIRPTARGRLVEWIEWALGAKPQLFRRPADASEDAALVPGIEGNELYGPCASETITVFAARQSGGAMVLGAVDRPSQ